MREVGRIAIGIAAFLTSNDSCVKYSILAIDLATLNSNLFLGLFL